MKTAEDILKSKLNNTNWNYLEHVLHSGEVYKQILEGMEEYRSQSGDDDTVKESIISSLRNKLTPFTSLPQMIMGGVEDFIVEETAEQCNKLYPVIKDLLTELNPYDKTSMRYLLECAFEAGGKFKMAEIAGRNILVPDFDEWYAKLPEIKDSEIYQKIKLYEAQEIVDKHNKEEESKHQTALTALHYELTQYFKSNLLDGSIILKDFELRDSYGNKMYEIIPDDSIDAEEYSGGNDKDIEKICKKNGIKAAFVSWMYHK